MKISFPYQMFFNKYGTPLNGFVYVGEEGKNPELYPIDLYYDANREMKAAQPLQVLNGYIVRVGTPTDIYCYNQNYSILVKDSSNKLVFSKIRSFNTVSSFANVFDYLSQDEIDAAKSMSTSLDLTESIQTAIDATNCLYFPPGLYNVTTLIINKQMAIRGSGEDCTIIRQSSITDGYNSTLYTKSENSDTNIEGISIKDLTICGPEASPVFSQHEHLISFQGVTGYTIKNVKFSGFKGDGVYAGSTENRHNYHIDIDGCFFDGINNNNRNGVSVIDGTVVNIHNSRFINCTKSNMPGAIDFEPNEEWQVVQKINVSNCYFDNVLGSTGVVSVVAAGMSYYARDIIVSNNVFNAPGRFFTFISNQRLFDGEFPDNKLNLSGNVGSCNQFYEVHGFVSNHNIFGNNIEQSASSVFGYAVRGEAGERYFDTLKNYSIVGNKFKQTNQASPHITTTKVDGMVFSGNVFTGGSEGIRFGKITIYDSDSSAGDFYVKNVSIIGNRFYSEVSNAKFITSRNALYITGTPPVSITKSMVYGDTCRYYGNEASLHSFPAWLTDDCGNNVVIGEDDTDRVKVPTFSATTLPDSFPVGVSKTFMNYSYASGDHLPVVSQVQGTLETHKSNNYYTKWVYQIYNHVANPVTNRQYDGMYYIRHRNASTNTWNDWYRLEGIHVTLDTNSTGSLRRSTELATGMITGGIYTITYVGTTNFTAYGAPDNTPGLTFIATSVPTTGTGTVLRIW